MKKPGFFLSESKLVEKIQSHLGILQKHRFPLAYIMEAADDIAYCVADLEDAVENGVINIKELHRFIQEQWEDKSSRLNDDSDKKYLINVTDAAMSKSECRFS